MTCRLADPYIGNTPATTYHVVLLATVEFDQAKIRFIPLDTIFGSGIGTALLTFGSGLFAQICIFPPFLTWCVGGALVYDKETIPALVEFVFLIIDNGGVKIVKSRLPWLVSEDSVAIIKLAVITSMITAKTTTKTVFLFLSLSIVLPPK